MCFNIQFTIKNNVAFVERFDKILNKKAVEDLSNFDFPTYYFISGFDNPKLPLITNDGVKEYNWGLIPSWIKDNKAAFEIKSKTLNAMGETVFEKPSFKKSILSQRCLLPINGFYEWQEMNKSKIPYHISSKENEIFCLGCVFDIWLNNKHEEVKTFSIITTPANEMMAKIHNIKKRMPLIIDQKDEEKWIDEKLSEYQIQSLIKTSKNEFLKAYTISSQVNSVKENRNVPEVLKPQNYIVQNSLF